MWPYCSCVYSISMSMTIPDFESGKQIVYKFVVCRNKVRSSDSDSYGWFGAFPDTWMSFLILLVQGGPFFFDNAGLFAVTPKQFSKLCIHSSLISGHFAGRFLGFVFWEHIETECDFPILSTVYPFFDRRVIWCYLSLGIFPAVLAAHIQHRFSACVCFLASVTVTF